MHWSDKFLSTPYFKLNCAEFVEMVLRKHYGIDLKFPQSEGGFFNQSDQIKKNLGFFAEKREFSTDFEEGDMVLMGGEKRLAHIGLLISVNSKLYVLHSFKKTGYTSRIRLNELSTLGLSFQGVYRWLI